MDKTRILFGVIGLFAGMIIGFMFANSVNRVPDDGISGAGNQASLINSGLPPDHPSLQQPAGAPQGGGVPEVTAAIDLAKQRPEDFDAQLAAGDLYYRIQRFEDAAEFYEKASKLKPDSIAPLAKLGNSLFEAGKFEEAEKWYLAALAKEPDNGNIRTDLALTFYLRTPRDLDRAIKEYNVVLEKEPEKEITLQNLALAYREAGDQQNLGQTVERLKKINPNNPFVLRLGSAQPGV